jgi:PIN domain nuclease of toxin-antitoxin system
VAFLLDTCTLLWGTTEPRRLSTLATRLLKESEDTVYISAISAWEIILKSQLNQYKLRITATEVLEQAEEKLAATPLPFTHRAALHSARLPLLHKDPFDRMLICQAMVDGLTIITPDQAITQYPVMTIW